ncbi:hypothetical protein ACRAWC_22610 [Leifsonia sp. L25]|uniref:hypothetical protein n=1 Tax=Leifsonia sp. L25 TaxID=3423957 RepID=UPI003D692A53
MELVEQHLLPGGLQLLARVLDAVVSGDDRGPALGVQHRELRAPLPRLDARVRRVASRRVVLQVVAAHREPIEERLAAAEDLVEVGAR